MPERATATTSADLSRALAEPQARSGVHDFDFLGTWKVAHCRLKRCWVGSDEGGALEGVSTCRKALSGVANVEEIARAARGFSGLTLRAFDYVRDLWSIYWVNSTRGVFEPPVTGRLANGRCLFEGDDGHRAGAPRLGRDYTLLGPLDKSFSDDSGRTCKTDWILDSFRTES
ncbi:MAG TPA: hypothetical protein VGN97_03115 [Mesorhizobium sp.]|jgi:hypothetical protein|nr:hypothetical protein [Mesorhizobium sp.]